MNRHRAGPGSKISYKHHLIEGLRTVLEDLALEEGVKSIIPGVIRRKASGPPHMQLKVAVDTRTGLKLIARRRDSLQEVFITGDPCKLRQILSARD